MLCEISEWVFEEESLKIENLFRAIWRRFGESYSNI